MAEDHSTLSPEESTTDGISCIVRVDCERGCSWDNDEYRKAIFTTDPLTQEHCEAAFSTADEWVAIENRHGHGLDYETVYVLRMRLVYCDDGSGALLDEYFQITDFSVLPWPD